MKTKIRKEFTIKIKGHADSYDNLEDFEYNNLNEFAAFVKKLFNDYQKKLEDIFNGDNPDKTDALSYLKRDKKTKAYEDPYLHNFNFESVDEDIDD
jgi:hypothetical protein